MIIRNTSQQKVIGKEEMLVVKKRWFGNMQNQAENFFKQFDKIIMIAKNVQMQETGFKLDSKKKFYLKVLDLVKETESDTDVIDL